MEVVSSVCTHERLQESTYMRRIGNGSTGLCGGSTALKDITFKPLDLSETNNKDLRLLLEVLNTEIDYLDLGIMVKVDNSELQL